MMKRTGRSGLLWPGVASVVLYATLPYAGLLGANVGEPVDVGRVAVYWAGTVAVAVLPIFAAGYARGNVATARRLGLVVSVFVFLFFNYPLAVAIQDALSVPDYFHPGGWAILALVVLLASFPLSHRRAAQTYVALTGAGLLLLPMAQLAVGLLATPGGDGAPPTTTDGSPAPVVEALPNIYYFVPDGHAALDVVQAETGVDVSGFASALEQRGFEVSEDARANYPTTFASISSTLERSYLLEPGDIPSTSDLLERVRGDNATVDRLRELGYRYVHAYPGVWSGSRCSGREDLCLGDDRTWGETDAAILALTPLETSPFIISTSPTETLDRTSDPRRMVDATLAHPGDGPLFLFAHLLMPHPPFIWDAECRLRDDVAFKISDWPEDQRSWYGETVACLDQRFLDAVDRILEVDPDPVIVIQADHGSAFSFTWELSGEEWLEEGSGRERLSILSAIRLPERCGERSVPEDLTPVNTFRIVLACVEGREPELLPNRSYLVRYRGEPVEALDP